MCVCGGEDVCLLSVGHGGFIVRRGEEGGGGALYLCLCVSACICVVSVCVLAGGLLCDFCGVGCVWVCVVFVKVFKGNFI